MPIYESLPDLLTRIQDDVTTNGVGAINGQVTRDLLKDTVLSLAAILGNAPPEVVAEFPAWDADVTYTGGEQTVVSYGGTLYLFISEGDSLGDEPGTNALVWQEFSVLSLAHFRNKDQKLDEGGPYESTAQQLYELQRFGWPTFLYVHAAGNDATAQRGKLFCPYQSLHAAVVASHANDVIVVMGSGTFPMLGIIGWSLTIIAPAADISATGAPFGMFMAENGATIVRVTARSITKVAVQQNATMYVTAKVTGVMQCNEIGGGTLDVTGDVGSIACTYSANNATLRGRCLGNVVHSAGSLTIKGEVVGTITKTGGDLALFGGPFHAVVASGAGTAQATGAHIESFIYGGTGAHPALLAKGCTFGATVDPVTVDIDESSVANVGMAAGDSEVDLSGYATITYVDAADDAEETARDGAIAAAVSAHASADDPHEDRAYTDDAVAAEVAARNTAIGYAVASLGTAAAVNTGTAEGDVPVLGTDGLLPVGMLPPLAIVDTYAVDSEAEMLALDAEKGDVAVRSDLNKTYILRVDGADTLSNWTELLTPTGAVLSVAALTGAISASDLRDALDLVIGTDVEAYVAPTTNADMVLGDKSRVNTNAKVRAVTVGDNSSLSGTLTSADTWVTALRKMQTQMSLRSPLASPTFTGTVTVPTPADGDNSTKAASTAFVVASFAPKASPAFTGNPTVPTQSPSDNSTKAASTAYADAAVAAALIAASKLSYNSQSGTSYTLALTDAVINAKVKFTNSSPVAVMIPTNASVAFPIGSIVPMRQGGDGAVTISGASGVTVNQPDNFFTSIGKGAQWVAEKVDTNEWDVYGMLQA